MLDDSKEQEIPLKKAELIRFIEYTLRITGLLHDRLEKHIRLRKRLDETQHTKQKWVEEACREKLKIEQELGVEGINSDRYLHFKLNPALNKEIDQRIELLKKFKILSSKKQWVVEAIFEKLEREEQSAKKLMQNMLEKLSEPAEDQK